MKWYIWVAIIVAILAFATASWQAFENTKWMKQILADKEDEKNGESSEGNDENGSEGS